MKNKLKTIGVIPVVSIDHIDDALPIAKALLECKFNIIEITLRSDCAIEAIKRIKENYPEICIGIGTVTNKSQVDEILKLHPDFIVTPGFNPSIIQYALDHKLTVIPGIDSASLVEQAMEFELDFVKFFPAEASGGLPKIKALSGPYPKMNFMPTGGVNLDNLNDYLSFNKIIAVGGTFFIDKTRLKEKNYDHIKENCFKVIKKLLNLKVESIEVKDANSSSLIQNLFNLNSIQHTNKNKIVITTSNLERFNYFYPNYTFLDFEVEIKEV